MNKHGHPNYNFQFAIRKGGFTSKGNIIEDKSFKFALRIIKLYKHLTVNKKEFILSKQVLRSGTAIGAMVREAIQAESRADFIHKLAMANKETNETEYWIQLLKESGYIDLKSADSLLKDNQEIKRILSSIIITTKKNIKQK